MRIAVCDDNKKCRDDITAILQTCKTDIPDMSVTEFASGLDLLARCEKQAFDLLLLDVEMPGLDGIATGRKIRDIDKDVIIVYLTSHKEYVFKSLSIEIFDYLIKPPDAAAVRDMLERAVKKYTEQHRVISFKYEGVTYSLEVGDIEYIEGFDRHIYIVTASGRYKCVGKLGDYQKDLLPYGFLRCHQRFLVNMRHIASIDSKSILTVSGNSAPMSARKRSECMSAFAKFLSRYEM